MNGCLQLAIIAALMVAAIVFGSVSPAFVDAAVASGDVVITLLSKLTTNYPSCMYPCR